MIMVWLIWSSVSHDAHMIMVCLIWSSVSHDMHIIHGMFNLEQCIT